jgi:cytochrome P450
MARWMKKPPPRCAAAWRPLPPPRVPPAGRHGHERDPHQPRPVSALDPFSAEFRADPFAAYAELRATGPIVWLEQYGIWVVQHHAQVKDVLTDWRRFSNAGGGGLTNYFKEPNWRQPSIILEVDPPEHERTRKVMMRVINANAIKSLRGGFEAVARRLVDAALAQGEIEAISQLVQPFPSRSFPMRWACPRSIATSCWSMAAWSSARLAPHGVVRPVDGTRRGSLGLDRRALRPRRADR